MADNSASRRPSPVASGDAKPKIRIVVADDHPIFRDGLCKLLALEEDFDVVAQAQDGKQVLEVLQQHEPDILLLDLRMPGLDGLSTLQRLQAVNKTRIIVLTASPTGRLANGARFSGMSLWRPRSWIGCFITAR